MWPLLLEDLIEMSSIQNSVSEGLQKGPDLNKSQVEFVDVRFLFPEGNLV